MKQSVEAPFFLDDMNSMHRALSDLTLTPKVGKSDHMFRKGRVRQPGKRVCSDRWSPTMLIRPKDEFPNSRSYHLSR